MPCAGWDSIDRLTSYLIPRQPWLLERLAKTKSFITASTNIRAFSGVDAQSLIHLEAQLIQKADLVVVSSQRLYEAQIAGESEYDSGSSWRGF